MFTVTFSGIDGTSTTKFRSLAAAAKYVKDRWQGIDYRRSDTEFGSDYGTYSLGGFSLGDLGKLWIATDDYGYPVAEYEFFTEFGGTYDRELDPKGVGPFRVLFTVPRYDDRDAVCGWTGHTVATAATAAEAFARRTLYYERHPDPDPDAPGLRVVDGAGRGVWEPPAEPVAEPAVESAGAARSPIPF